MKKIPAMMLRVSTEEQTHGESLDAQKDRLFSLAKNKGFCEEDIKIFKIVESSTIGGRKKFYEMIEWVKAQEGTICLFVEAIDRLQRSFKESTVIDDLREQEKIEIYFYKEGIALHKNSNPQEIIMWDMSVIGAKLYVQSISHNVKRTNERKLANNEILGLAPIGYLNAIDATGKKTVIVDSERKHFIRRAFQEYAKGIYSLLDITKMLNKWGLRSRKGKDVPKATIHNMIQNPFYIGMMVYKGKRYPHFYERIIDKETFDKCQEVRLSYGKKPFKYGNKPYIFRGLIKCAHCGCTITTEEKKGHKYLFCSKYKGDCEQKRAKEEDLLKEIQGAFEAIQIPEKTLSELQEKLQKSLYAKKQFQFEIIAGLDKEYKNNQEKLDTLLELCLNKSITEDQFNQKRAALQQRQEEILEEKKLHTNADEKFAVTLSYLLSVASRAYEIFRSSKVDQQRELINFVLWNPRLEKGKLRYDYRKPFDVFVRAAKCQTWLPRLDSNQ